MCEGDREKWGRVGGFEMTGGLCAPALGWVISVGRNSAGAHLLDMDPRGGSSGEAKSGF